MTRSGLFLLVFLAALLSSVCAQDSIPNFDASKALDMRKVKRAKTYYSLEEALREPDKVIKLSLQRSKIKSFPYEIFRFKNLHYLDLSNNKLKEIPTQISDLPYLVEVNLYNNKLRVLPQSMQYLSQLGILYLGRNKLTRVPAWVGGLGKLRHLDLVYNHITPHEILQLQNQLRNCKITH